MFIYVFWCVVLFARYKTSKMMIFKQASILNKKIKKNSAHTIFAGIVEYNLSNNILHILPSHLFRRGRSCLKLQFFNSKKSLTWAAIMKIIKPGELQIYDISSDSQFVNYLDTVSTDECLRHYVKSKFERVKFQIAFEGEREKEVILLAREFNIFSFNVFFLL